MFALRQDLSVLRIALIVVVIGLPAFFGASAALAQQGDAEDAEEYTGEFQLVFAPVHGQAFQQLEAQIREAEIFEQTIEELNQTLALPTDLEITFSECDGVANAFYDPEQTRVVMCYELIAMFAKQFADDYEDPEEAEVAVLDATLFVFHHELGHAVVHLLDLPVTGKEEDAVDDLATVILIRDWEGGDESALNAAQAFYKMGEKEEEAAAEADESQIESLPYYDEHSLGKQRYYQIACIVYGSDPEAHADLVGEHLPPERAQRCPAEFEQKDSSWDRLLADYYKDSGDQGEEQE